MGIRKVFSVILRLPLWLLVLASCGAAYYAVYANLIEGLTWKVPAIYTGIIILYLIGLLLKDGEEAEEEAEEEVEAEEEAEEEVEDEEESEEAEEEEVQYEGNQNTNTN